MQGMRGMRGIYRETSEKPSITKKLIFRILTNFKPYWKLMAVMFLTIIAISILGIIPSILSKNIIDIALPQANVNVLLINVALYLGNVLLLNLLNVAQSYLNTLVSKGIIRDLRSSMYKHLQQMSLKFFSNAKTGEITSRINNDINGIESVFSNTYVSILQGIFIFVTTAVTLFYTNWILAIVTLLTLPLFLFPTRKVGKVRWGIASKTQAKLAELTSIITETLNVSGITLIKIFTKEADKAQEFDSVNAEVTKLAIRESLVGRWFFMTMQTFIAMGPILIYLCGGLILIQTHSITIGGIVMFVTLVSRLYGPVNTFANIHVDIVRSMALFERIFEYFDMKSEIVEKPDAKNAGLFEGNIRFNHVHFSYGEKDTTLSDVDFEIKPGQMAAFVGPSGAGKTTITNLVPRLYDVTAGAVLIDGMNIKDITLHSLRSQIGMVTQDTFLFNTTIRENLLFARPDASVEDVEQACRTANIHDFIASLPNGYDTVVGERGVKLSGGEKQRVSIARTILKNPRIVIFDEATSSLDSNSETLIQQAIKPLLSSRTSLVIAHRLSTIVSADVIFVVQDGRIVERGKHAELLQKGGVYRDLYDKQFKVLEEQASSEVQ